jgi:transcription elongation factor GreB
MSKAFTRESDDLPELPAKKTGAPTLPPGVKNYFTLEGINKLHNELHELSLQAPSSSLRQRLSEIEENLRAASVVDPPPKPWNQVLFGAFVTVRNQQREQFTYHIVGVGETDLDRNYISWLSPVAKALLKQHVGDHIRSSVPAGDERLEIVEVHY